MGVFSCLYAFPATPTPFLPLGCMLSTKTILYGWFSCSIPFLYLRKGAEPKHTPSLVCFHFWHLSCHYNPMKEIVLPLPFTSITPPSLERNTASLAQPISVARTQEERQFAHQAHFLSVTRTWYKEVILPNTNPPPSVSHSSDLLARTQEVLFPHQSSHLFRYLYNIKYLYL